MIFYIEAFLNDIFPSAPCHTSLMALRSGFSWGHHDTEIKYECQHLRSEIMSLSYLMNWMAGTFFLLVISVTYIMARLLVAGGAFFGVNRLGE